MSNAEMKHVVLVYVKENLIAKLGSHGGKDFTKVMAISKGMEQRR